MASTGDVYPGLYGDDFEPEDVTALIGLAVAKIARRGERNAVAFGTACQNRSAS